VSGGTKYTTLDEFESVWQSMNDEEKYKFWHDYNVNTIFNEYSAWLDAMLDCNYAKEENIRINGEKFTVYDPLDPTSYFEWDDEEECITAGRYMVFSRSEMAYYGLSWEDLTQVEQKIITIQDNVYEESLDLMNYYTLSDETLIQAYAMIQLFEFNKEFSQTGLFTEDYVLYPQSYELKAFTYDAYLRLILAGSTGEDLMTTADDTTTTDETSTATNTSIYQRILENTSIFFGIVLLIDDFIAVYILPAFKLAFLIIIFLLSIAMIIASAVKLETPIQAFWKSLLAPMLSFAMISIGMAWLISKFMSEGAQGVVQTSELIQLGDPTMTIAVMVVINVVAMVLYWKILKKCWKDFVTYTKAVFSSIGGALAGAVGAVTGAITSGKRGATELKNRHATNKNTRALNKQAKTAEQRGKDNNPKSGKHSLGSAAVGAGVGAGIATGLGAAAAQNESKAEAKARKYDAKAAKLEKKAEKQKNTQDDIIKDLEKKKNKLDPSATNRSKKLDDKIQKAKNKSKRLEDRAANKKNYLNKKSQNVKDSGRFKGGIRNTAMAMGRFGSHINGGQKGVIADATVGRLSSGAHNVKKGAINLGSSAINTVGSGVSTLKSDFKTGKASKSVVYEAPKPPTPPPTPKTPSNKVQGKKARARKKSASRAARRNH
jgi:hypothetical protein